MYKVGDKLWINKALFKDAYSKSQASDKLSAKRFGPFKVTKLVGKNAVELEFPDHVKIHKVVNISAYDTLLRATRRNFKCNCSKTRSNSYNSR